MSLDFPILVKRIGPFEVFKNESYNSYALVRAICEDGNNAFSIEIINKLTKFQLDSYLPIRWTSHFSVKASRVRLKGIKRVMIQHSSIINVSPEDAIKWLEANGAQSMQAISITRSFKTDKLSVAPCAFQTNDGHKYVRVRFDGISVPFFINTKGWDQNLTRQYLIKCLDPGLVDSILKSIDNHLSSIIARVKERPLNLSRISEYGQNRLTYWEEKSPGKFIHLSADEVKIVTAKPDYDPVIVYSFDRSRNLVDQSRNAYDGWSGHFTAFNEKLYSIPGFYSPKMTFDYNTKKQIASGEYHPDYTQYLYGTSKSMFKLADCKLVPSEDEYIRTKVGRTIKAKI